MTSVPDLSAAGPPASVDPSAPRWPMNRLRVAWYSALGLLTLVGVVSGVIWIVEGNKVTNLTSIVPWGAWVAFYLFFLGLSAGSFLVSTLIYVFGMEQFESIGRSALLSAIVSMGVGLAFIGVDLGRVERTPFVMMYFHWTSPLSWEVRFYVIYIAVLIVELIIAIRVHKRLVRSRERAARWLRILGTIGIPLAIFGVHGGTGTIFAVLKARGLWSGGLFPVIFVVSAMVSGTALLLVIYFLERRIRRLRPDPGVVNGLASVLTAVLLIDLGLMFYEFVVPLLAFQHHETTVISVITTGPMWWSFWIVQLGLGMIVPAVILLAPRLRARHGALVTAGCLVLMGVVGVRFNIVIPPFIPAIMDGLPDGTYAPNALEWALSIGFIAAGVLVYSVVSELLPIHESDPDDHPTTSSAATAGEPEGATQP